MGFLVGNRREKKAIEKLLFRSPVPISYDYIYLCICLLEYLVDADIKNKNDFDGVLFEFLDSLKIEIQERVGGSVKDIDDYAERVEEALQYLKKYLRQLDWIPIPKNIHVKPVRGDSVMLLYTI